jgi:metal-responsive CopG/Arc/MetJ family transcriptional regulator
MKRVNITISKEILEALDAVAKTKGRTRSQQVRESLQNDPDVYEVLEGIRA